jgi:DNA-binding transcriptional LysR family regulator
MVRRHYSLPSLNSLAAFEAAARHRSLTRASGELNVTPGAVSKQVKQLEEEIGAALFVRLHRALELTAEGDALFLALQESFTRLADSLRSIRAAGGPRSVTIGTTSAFAQLWLMPRLGAFWNAHQDIVVDHMISDRSQESQRNPVDLRVRYGNGTFPDEDAVKLFDDHILAVASPAFLSRHGVTELADAAALQLLSVEGLDWSWTTWADFFHAAHIPARRLNVRRFNSYVIALQAALDGQGIALGWKSLVTPPLMEGKLASLTGFEMVAPQSFFLTWSARHGLSKEAEILRDWLIAAAKA